MSPIIEDMPTETTEDLPIHPGRTTPPVATVVEDAPSAFRPSSGEDLARIREKLARSVDFTCAHSLTPEVEAAIDDAFEYHAWDDDDRAREAVRDSLIAAVKAIVAYVPPSADRTTAIRKIREARMDANSAITHGGRY